MFTKFKCFSYDSTFSVPYNIVLAYLCDSYYHDQSLLTFFHVHYYTLLCRLPDPVAQPSQHLTSVMEPPTNSGSLPRTLQAEVSRHHPLALWCHVMLQVLLKVLQQVRWCQSGEADRPRMFRHH